MDKYEICITCFSNFPEVSLSDISCVKKAGFKWGRRDLKEFLIIPAIGLTQEDINNMIIPYYKEGLRPTENIIIPQISSRRYQIPFDVLFNRFKYFDDHDAKNLNYHYQPFKDLNIEIDFSEKVGICFDKHKKSFKYKLIKGV